MDSRRPQALQRVRAPSGPLLHSGVSARLQLWHLPGAAARYLVLADVLAESNRNTYASTLLGFSIRETAFCILGLMNRIRTFRFAL